MTDADLESEPTHEPAVSQAAARPALGRWVLVTVLVAAAGAALWTTTPFGRTSAVASAAVPAPAPLEAAPAAPATPDTAANTLSGTVIERLDVPKYTYLRLDAGQPGGTWAAVASASIEVGKKVRIVDAQLMTGFVSATLKRTFDAIYFGALDDGTAPTAPAGGALVPFASLADDPHAGIPGAPALGPRQGASAAGNPHGTDNPHAGTNPHGALSPAPDTVVVGQVPKAEGRSGHTVAEVHARRRSLKDQSVRVRGVVVKVTTGVLGRSFIRLRDGSEHDDVKELVVTTLATPAVGDRVLVEGKVTTDKDLGAGYVYPVLIEDAVLSGP